LCVAVFDPPETVTAMSALSVVRGQRRGQLAVGVVVIALFQHSNHAILFRQSQSALMQLLLQALHLSLQDRVLGTQQLRERSMVYSYFRLASLSWSSDSPWNVPLVPLTHLASARLLHPIAPQRIIPMSVFVMERKPSYDVVSFALSGWQSVFPQG
jgi:hypothetical protein